MNLRKWGYLYLPIASIVLGFSAILLDVIYAKPIKPTVFILIAIMTVIIFIGFKTKPKR